jgi:hypothetical protein
MRREPDRPPTGRYFVEAFPMRDQGVLLPNKSANQAARCVLSGSRGKAKPRARMRDGALCLLQQGNVADKTGGASVRVVRGLQGQTRTVRQLQNRTQPEKPKAHHWS